MGEELNSNNDTSKGPAIQSAEKIYNIGNIENANFGFVPGKKAFNVLLTKQLINQIQEYHPKIKDFLKGIPEDFKDNWESEKTYLNQAKGLVEENFVWIVGWQLRRLFAIGNKTASPEQTDDYLEQCLMTFKLTMQLITFSLVAHLWDELNGREVNPGSDLKAVSILFESKIELRPDQYLEAFKSLLVLYKINSITLPFKEMRDVEVFNNEEGVFMKACGGLFEIREVYNQSKQNPEHCFQAEEHLTVFLTSFRFLANYQLISMKKIEYDWQRNSEPRYLRQFNILGKNIKQTGPQQLLKYGTEPLNTYSLFLRNNITKINLFPFILDYNALTNEEGSKICLFNYRFENSGLNYFFIDDESKQTIEFTGVMKAAEKDQIVKDEQHQNLKFDIVLSQFIDAQNAILGTSDSFETLTDQSTEFGNL